MKLYSTHTPHPLRRFLMIDRIRKFIQSHLPPGSFARNVITLMTGTTFAQALMILVAPILTRLYTPRDFGIFALYTSILGVLAVVACWRYELAIVMPEKDEDAANLLLLSIIICFGMTGLILILVAVLRTHLAQLLSSPGLAPWLMFLPLSLIVAGLFQATNYWSTRNKQFKLLAMRSVTNSTVTAVTQLGVGSTLALGAGGLIAGSILGQLVATVRLTWHTIKNDGNLIWRSLSCKKIKSNAVEYKRFPSYLNLAGLLNVSSVQLPTLLLGYYFGTSVVGFYALGVRVVSFPLSVIGGSVAQVFFPRASEAYRNGNLDIMVLKTFTKLISIILVPILLLMLSGPHLVSLVFGLKWHVAGEYLVWMAPKYLAQFISSPLAMIFLVLQRQDINLKIDAMLFIANTVLIIIGGLLGNPVLAIQFLGMGTFVCYSIICLTIFRISGVSFSRVFKQVINTLLRAIPYIILPLITVIFTDKSLVITITSILCGLAFLLFNARNLLKKETI